MSVAETLKTYLPAGRLLRFSVSGNSPKEKHLCNVHIRHNLVVS